MKGAFDNLLFYSGLFRGWSYLYTVIFGWSKFAYPVVPRWSIPNQASYQLLYPFAYSVVLWWSISKSLWDLIALRFAYPVISWWSISASYHAKAPCRFSSQSGRGLS